MTSKPLRTVVGFAAIACLAACGNYSNEDLDYQLALPQQSDVEANARLSQVRFNSAPYYRDTRNAITTFNAMVTNMLAVIENVRGLVATTRQGNRRIWGPFPAEKYPTTWQLRVVMDKSTVSPTLLHMDYWVQVRPVGSDDSAWVSFLKGSYESSGSARTGKGEIQLLVADVRLAKYPVDDDPGLAKLDHLEVQYDNSTYPVVVKLTIVNIAGADTKTGTYDYSESQDGSGSMSFDWQGITSDTGIGITARMTAQWKSSGEGRADVTARLTANTTDTPTVMGTDCWGSDTGATYSYRRRTNGATTDTISGYPATCVF